MAEQAGGGQATQGSAGTTEAKGPVSPGGGDVHDWGPLVGDLQERRARALAMGGPERVERQHSLGKLTVRERLDLLLDPGTWVEYGLLADHMDPAFGDRHLAADGCVTGVGEIDGRRVAITV
ncbi:MAG TPA: carboxyl transferase domain-containing protein, partial [Acidimicrobiia bacterium]|nr:carboxyl transferase domain-containing protein [Acidimicrobiia bacterium]